MKWSPVKVYAKPLQGVGRSSNWRLSVNYLTRAGEIGTTPKRLARLSEKLLQFARAEGGPLRSRRISDLRPILRLITEDLGRSGGEGRIALSLPPDPVLSDIDPDAFGILCRNLIENALRHGTLGTAIEVELELWPEGSLSVTNDAPAVPPERLARLTSRFERAGKLAEGSGLGLAIVRTLLDRMGGELRLESPVPGGRETSGPWHLSLPAATSPDPRRYLARPG